MIHDILHEKLRLYGIKGVANALLKNYFSDRKQLEQIPTGEKSTFNTVNMGVPQGSVQRHLILTDSV